MKNPTLRLIKRLTFSCLFLGLISLTTLLYIAITVYLGLKGESATSISLTSLVTSVFGMTLYWVILKNELAAELQEREGKPIKVFLPGKKNYRFIQKLGFHYGLDKYYPVLVNPREDKFTFVKHLYLLDPGSKFVDEQLLNVAADNAAAFTEITSKMGLRKYVTSSDLMNLEKALAISESIKDIVK